MVLIVLQPSNEVSWCPKQNSYIDRTNTGYAARQWYRKRQRGIAKGVAIGIRTDLGMTRSSRPTNPTYSG
jgi:hypothetical protein